MPIVPTSTYSATIQTPLAADNYSAILVTISQGRTTVSKTLDDLTIDNGLVVVQLTQEETEDFTPGLPALMQIKCYRTETDAPGSAIWSIPVTPVLNEEVLP